MKFERQPLPVKIHVPLFEPVHLLIFGKHELNTEETLLYFNNFKREYDLGSYSKITQKTIVKYNNKKQTTVISLHYAVYNDIGVLQWPIL